MSYVRQRDLVARATRFEICAKWPFVPFRHQAAWWAAADGYLLTDEEESPDSVMDYWNPDADPWAKMGYHEMADLPPVVTVDGSQWWLIQLDDKSKVYTRLKKRQRGPAKLLAQLGSFKSGKSSAAGLFVASYARVGKCRIDLVGNEYDTSEPEYDYTVDFTLSERGLNLSDERMVKNIQNGDMFLAVKNGCTYQARSWSVREKLEGKERDAYLFTESYQLPGLLVYNELSQNLDARKGLAIFPSTRKRPWVEELIAQHKSDDPAFDKVFAVWDIDRRQNPYTHSDQQRAYAAATMTQEKFQIHWEGKGAQFVGSCFKYHRGQRQFSPKTHPELFKKPNDTSVIVTDVGEVAAIPENLDPPRWYERTAGVDTGTHYACVSALHDDEGNLYVVGEHVNYRYVSGEIEVLRDVTIPEWAGRIVSFHDILGGNWPYYADWNAQGKHEYHVRGITLRKGERDPELRTEILREHFQHGRIWLAPWLEVLPFELENARFPEKETSTGKFRRISDRDHALDCLEHLAAKRRQAKAPENPAPWGVAERYAGKRLTGETFDPALG